MEGNACPRLSWMTHLICTSQEEYEIGAVLTNLLCSTIKNTECRPLLQWKPRHGIILLIIRPYLVKRFIFLSLVMKNEADITCPETEEEILCYHTISNQKKKKKPTCNFLSSSVTHHICGQVKYEEAGLVLPEAGRSWAASAGRLVRGWPRAVCPASDPDSPASPSACPGACPSPPAWTPSETRNVLRNPIGEETQSPAPLHYSPPLPRWWWASPRTSSRTGRDKHSNVAPWIAVSKD